MMEAIDFARVRTSLDRLDAIAEAHPELLAAQAGDPSEGAIEAWMETLQETLQEQEMSEKDPTKLSAHRLPLSLIARLDRCAAKVTEAIPWAKVTRADVVRMALIRGLDAWEAEQDDD